jgi:predicted nuclease of predicted toxin-antitoxin system
MALRFFADHCISNLITQSLESSGHEVLRLQDYVPAESPDSVVIAKAQELDAVLLSLNGDFADIVTYPPAQFKGIIALQILNHPEITAHLIERLNRYLALHPASEDYRGKLIVVEVNRIRVRQ